MDGHESRLDLITSWGIIHATARHGRIVSCGLPLLKRQPSRAFVVLSHCTVAASADDRDALRRARVFIAGALKGRRVRTPPVMLPATAPFRRRVWRALARVRSGETVTYAQLARRAGAPKAARAAGQACAMNPLPLFIPCHRVLGAGGRLGGFSCGLPWKVFLLERESA